MRILAYLLVGLTVGGLSGLLGIGGGVLLVPILVWLFGFDQSKAAGTTLATLVMPVALPAAWKYYSSRLIDLEAAVCIAVAFAVGGYLSAGFVHHVPERLLRQGFGLLMLYIGARFLLSANSEAANMTAGLVAAGLGWVAYLTLRARGRRYIAKPELKEEVRRMQELGRGEPDYS